MSSGLLDLFSKIPPRENSGSRSANRFDYQKNWSLCELLSLHSKNDDYLMVFEHHEDVVVFDSESFPTTAVFYQVKTKNPGNWTVNALSKEDKNGQSIISKLYANYEQFQEAVEALVFSSNHGLSTTLENEDKGIECELIRFDQLSIKDKEKISIAAEGNDKSYCDLIGLNKIIINQNELPVENHTITTKGKLVEFFEREFPDKNVHVALIYKSIFDEIRRKTNCEKKCQDSEELKEMKSISHKEFSNIIGVVLAGKTTSDMWIEANQLLVAEGFKALEIKRIRNQWQNYVVDRMNTLDESLTKLQQGIESSLKAFPDDLDLKEIQNNVLNELRLSSYFDLYDGAYIQSAVLYEVMNDDSISKTNKKLEEEAE